MRDRLRAQAAFAGVVTILWALATIPVMLTSLRNSVALLQFVSFYAIVMAHAILWREIRNELRTRKVEKEVTPD